MRLLVGILDSYMKVIDPYSLSFLQTIPSRSFTRSFTLLDGGNVLVVGDQNGLHI